MMIKELNVSGFQIGPFVVRFIVYADFGSGFSTVCISWSETAHFIGRELHVVDDRLCCQRHSSNTPEETVLPEWIVTALKWAGLAIGEGLTESL